MKRKALLLLIIMGLYGTAFSDGMQDKRCAWWQNHLRLIRLEKEKIEKKNVLDASVTAYLDREIQRTEKMISVFQGSHEDVKNSQNTPVSVTHEYMEKRVDVTVKPLVSLQLLKEAVMEIDRGSFTPQVRTMVKDRLTVMARTFFAEDTDELVQITMNTHIDREGWKIMAGEVMLGSIDSSRTAIINDVKGKIIEELTEGSANWSMKSLDEAILAGAMKHIAASEGIRPDEKALDKSWCWQQVHCRVDREFGHYSEIRTILPRGNDIPLAKIQYYYRNPQAMDTSIFTPPSVILPEGESESLLPAGKIHENPVVLTIPALPDTSLICREIDSLRLKALAHIRDKNDEAYVGGLNEEFEKIIITHTARCNNILLHEDKRIKDNGYHNEDMVNFNEFERAKREFRSQMQICYDHKARSMDFLTRVSQWRRLPRPRIMELLDYQMNQGGRYMALVTSLVRDCGTLSRLEDRKVYIDYVAAIKRIDGIPRFAMKGIVFDRDVLASLPANDIRSLRLKQTDCAAGIKGSRYEAGILYHEFLKNRDAAIRNEKNVDSTMKNLAAQFEIDTITGSLKDCRESFARYRYAETAFAGYRIAFDRLQNDALTGGVTAELGQVLDRGTLIPGLEGFDRDTLDKEMRARNYFFRKTRIELSRLVSVLQYYRHAGITVEGYPSADEMAEIESLLKKRPSVKIASWDMHESNFDLVDRKAAALISQTMKRSLWKPVKKEDDIPAENYLPTVTVTLLEKGITLSIPAGWRESHNKAPNNKTGVIRQFSSIDSETSISLVSLPLDKKNIKEISNRWLSGQGSKPLKERWGRQDDADYYWVLARGRDNRLSECYVIGKDGFAFIVEGNSTKNKYVLFSQKLGDVFRSIR
ncbi:MAG: hypothetical protein CVV44_07735 [Spirochaetae bacterium HGW-Spirochaetae-1]|jgi:hypothetical protein|nr:MAG: hypothetical protein CVV44_07735 [Spirochaetae bacterium HGW-Spirochaetae-1]